VEKLTVRDIDVHGKRVLVGVDFNVPLDEKTGAIMDDSRIRAALPTVLYLVGQGARVILASHLGRPDGKVVDSMRMAPVASRLAELLRRKVAVTRDCIGAEAENAAQDLADGDVLLLENLRFHAEEEKNDPAFAAALARLGEVYVNDAFGTAHRAHASITGVTKHLPAVAGLLMEKELNALGGLLEKPARPFAALLGGAKIGDKVALLQNIIGRVDMVLIGGGMAATFLKAKGLEIGKSLIEANRVGLAGDLMKQAAERKVNLVLPSDVVVAPELKAEAKTQTVAVDRVPADQRIADIGPQATRQFQDELKACRTVFWNGPMGVYEVPQFAAGTRAMAATLAGLKANTVIGGGSTADVVGDLGLTDKMTFVSTGGGASLALLGGEKLPGVEVLLDRGSKKLT
jgi:phosphoglycerate kinase